MARKAREASDNGIYHILHRSIGRQPLFEDDADKEKFCSILELCRAKSGFLLYYHHLSNSHVHLLLRIREEPLDTVFRRIGTRYVSYFNRRHDRSGTLFQGRFSSEPVCEDTRFLSLAGYLYRHPSKEGLCIFPKDYPYNSAGDYIRGGGLTDTEYGLSLMEPAGVEAFFNNCSEDTDEGFLDIRASKKKLSDESIKLKTVSVFGVSPGRVKDLSPERQLQIILWLKEQDGISLRRIARLCGMPLSRIYRM